MSQSKMSAEEAKQSFSDSCKEGNMEKLIASMEHLDINISENELGTTAIKTAIENRNFDIARFLIDKGAKIDINEELYLASKSGKNKQVNFLISLGADVNYLSEKNNSTPLRAACGSNHIETVKLLLKNGADVNKANTNKQTALLEAKEFEIVEILLDNGANINAFDLWNDTLLTETLNAGNLSLAKYLIKRGSNLSFKSNDEKRQLLRIRSTEGANFLIERGVNFDVELNCGDTPLYDAIFRNNLELIKVFLKAGVSINRKNKNGKTALMEACWFDRLEILKYFIENGAETNSRDDDDKSVMEYAAKSKDCGKYLVEKGIFEQENLETKYKCIKIACENKRVEFFKALIDNKVDLKIFDKFLHNPLQLASIAGHKDIVNLLITEGKVDVNHRNQVDETALALAKSKDKTEIVELLVEHGGVE